MIKLLHIIKDDNELIIFREGNEYILRVISSEGKDDASISLTQNEIKVMFGKLRV